MARLIKSGRAKDLQSAYDQAVAARAQSSRRMTRPCLALHDALARAAHAKVDRTSAGFEDAYLAAPSPR